MKPKKILRFYFSAESLERAFDNLIEHKAFDFGADTLACAERLCAVIGEKMQLERLWTYLDGILATFSAEERGTLLKYSLRHALPLADDERRAVKRAVIKFTRRARRLEDFADDICVLKKYFCLIKA